MVLPLQQHRVAVEARDVAGGLLAGHDSGLEERDVELRRERRGIASPLALLAYRDLVNGTASVLRAPTMQTLWYHHLRH